jgi:hypothetical protein
MHNFSPRYKQKRYQLRLVTAIIAAATGTFLLQQSSAATQVIDMEAEAGMVAGTASTASDQTASGGAAVRFNSGASGVPVGSTVLFNGDFNTGNLSQWINLQTRDHNASPGNYCTYSACVQGGGPGHPTAARFEVRPGDVPSFGGDERSEIRAIAATDVHEGDERWVEFSLKVESDFIPPTGQNGGHHSIVSQWHDEGAATTLHLDIDANKNLLIGHRWEANKKIIGPLDPGSWHDYVVHAKFSKNAATGFVEAWRDGVQVVPRQARATMATDMAYLKMGLYRGAEPFPQTVWFDNLRVTAP